MRRFPRYGVGLWGWQPVTWDEAMHEALRGYYMYGIKRRVYGVRGASTWEYRTEVVK
jgi:hypothetical protein